MKIVIDPKALVDLLKQYTDPANWQTIRLYADGGSDSYSVCLVGPQPAQAALDLIKKAAS